jgi:acetyl-CoA carboxylase biotin carboxyl carrier protein
MRSVMRTEMAATVLRVVVQPGRRVTVGDEIVVLEAMKMEIPVLAEVAGLVESVNAVVGATLQEGDVIATLLAAADPSPAAR